MCLVISELWGVFSEGETENITAVRFRSVSVKHLLYNLYNNDQQVNSACLIDLFVYFVPLASRGNSTTTSAFSFV